MMIHHHVFLPHRPETKAHHQLSCPRCPRCLRWSWSFGGALDLIYVALVTGFSLTSLVYIIAVGKHAQSTAATPLRSFLKFSQSLRRPPTVAIWLKGQSTDWLDLPSPTWSEKVRQHLPLGGVLREGSRS